MAKGRYRIHEIRQDGFPPPHAPLFKLGHILILRAVDGLDINLKIEWAQFYPRGGNLLDLSGVADYGLFNAVKARIWVNRHGRIFCGIDRQHLALLEREQGFAPPVFRSTGAEAR